MLKRIIDKLKQYQSLRSQESEMNKLMILCKSDRRVAHEIVCIQLHQESLSK
jgi:hypothetical protein